MKISLLLLVLFTLASCGGGRYHKSVIADCKLRNLSHSECTNDYYKRKYGDGSDRHRYTRGDRY